MKYPVFIPAGNGNGSWTLTGGWEYFYGTELLPEKPMYIMQTPDSGYFAGGFSGGTAGNLEDFYGVKMNNAGLEPSTFKYGFGDSEKSNAADIILRDPLYMGGYIIAGESSDSAGSAKAMLLKRNSAFSGGWSNMYTAKDPLTFAGCFSTSFNSVKESGDGGYICAGTVKKRSVSTRDIYVIKTDRDGNEEWSLLLDGGGDDFNGLAVLTSDGGFAVGYTSMLLTKTHYSYRLTKLSAAGDIEWQKEFDAGSDDDVFLRSVIQTYDGGYALCGIKMTYSGKRQVFIIKTDREGNVP